MARKRFRKKPVQVGETYDVNVTEVSRRGDGVARIKGFVIFIPGAQVGDQVKILIVAVKDRFAVARVLEE